MKNTPSIKLIKTIPEMKAFAEAAKKKKKKVGLIPTLGGLHEGHLSLVKAAKRMKKRCDLIVVSIFVNPLQFNPRDDLDAYPRDLEGDIEKLEKLGGVAAVFAPEPGEMYPLGHRTTVDVDDLSRRLCGRSRPGHFRGVSTVVLKLFLVVEPSIAFFGLKDYQQYLVIRKMVQDLNLDIEIVGRSIIRDSDGLALSTRNNYLTADQRPAAFALQRALGVAEKLISAGERKTSILISNMREVIRGQQGAEVDYIAICHPVTLVELEAVEAKSLIALAVWIGRARLIDNLLVDLVELEKKKKERLQKEKKGAAKKAPKAKKAK